ncbi:hypothetical protein H0176_24705 [Methylorubrum populi]|uniref:Uncharacterized protein n=1 Tax=Methylorubrum rhodesianum TaxID=29427 RepID=A0ABU9ZGI1_9HYPH|nr:hypothetical protein [Methylorubrum rhodesianum]MBK3405268.1 hypothetical protein [Methylorubrum rhodesianum]MBY0143436.1 hypothetical protein [Methylorubrum populi]
MDPDIDRRPAASARSADLRYSHPREASVLACLPFVAAGKDEAFIRTFGDLVDRIVLDLCGGDRSSWLCIELYMRHRPPGHARAIERDFDAPGFGFP